MTRLSAAWTVIELWTVSADDLLALNDVGAVPWAPLAQRRRLAEGEEERVTPEQREAFAQKMMEVVLKLAQQQAEERIKKQELQSAILAFLRGKFTDVPEEVAAKVRAIQEIEQLRSLISFAGSCPTLDAFRAQLSS